jgi:hypothetical protein
MVERFCDEAVWIEAGQSRTTGDPKRVVQMYLADVEQAEDELLAAEDAKAQQAPVITSREISTEELPEPASGPKSANENNTTPPADMFSADEGRWGSGTVRINTVTLEGDHGPAHVFHSGDRMTIRLQVTTDREVDDFAFGISIFSTDGVCCYGTNTDIEKMRSKSLEGEAEVSFVIERLSLVEGTYKLDVAAHKRDGFSYDYHRLLYTFRVKSRTKDVGIYRPPHTWRFSGNVRFESESDRSMVARDALGPADKGPGSSEDTNGN